LRLQLAGAAGALLLISGCAGDPLRVTRSPCPAVAVLQHAGTTTLFDPATSRDADAIDVTATITDVRGDCQAVGDMLVTPVSFTVLGQRTRTEGQRTVQLPVFAAVVQAGDRLVTKQLGAVTLDFADGQGRAQASGTAQVQVSRTAAILPADIQERIERERKPGDEDAAVDPMSEPEVREAVRNATFEVLLGFQLDDAALAYNVTK
jgi:hypothetical protein